MLWRRKSQDVISSHNFLCIVFLRLLGWLSYSVCSIISMFILLHQIINSLRAKTLFTHCVLPLNNFSHLISELVNLYHVRRSDPSVVSNLMSLGAKNVTNWDGLFGCDVLKNTALFEEISTYLVPIDCGHTGMPCLVLPGQIFLFFKRSQTFGFFFKVFLTF